MVLGDKYIRWGIVALIVVLAGGGYVYFLQGGVQETTIVIVPKEFVQQIAVSGKVIAVHDVDLGFAGGGRISRVYAQVGQTVAVGSSLAEIENGDLRAAVDQRKAALATQEAKLAALQAGTRPESIAVSQAAVASAESALVQSHQSLVNAIQSAYAVADDAVHNKVDQFINSPRSSPTLKFFTTDSQLGNTMLGERIDMEARLRDWQILQATLSTDSDLAGAVKTARMTLQTTGRLLANANTTLNGAISTQTSPTATIDGWIASIATGRAALETASGALTTQQSVDSAATTALITAQKNLALAQAGASREDIDAQKAVIVAARADVSAAQAQLSKTVIVAPFSGIVTKTNAKVGSTASANEAQISMESRGTFQIEGYVPEINISLVKPIQTAKVTLDAYGAGVNFDATLVLVDPSETIRDGVSTYRVVLQFAQPDARIKSGMTANVVIIAQKRTGIIAVPQGVVTLKDGRSVMQVKDGDKTTERIVMTGAISSLGEVEIISGLSDGDVIIVTTAQ